MSMQKSEKFYKNAGFPFQMTLCVALMFRSYVIMKLKYEPPFFVILIADVGISLCLWCLFKIYYQKPKKILTTGVFRYTRHPMYTGMLLMGVHLWWPQPTPLGVLYWVTLCMYVGGIFTAGYFQEKETLARFGKDAEDYYKKTPRLFLLYPFMRIWKKD